jgi:phage terminase large subunit
VRAFQYFSDKVAKVNETYMSITFVNGSEIICSGLDDTEKLKSIYEITDIWVEEASEITKADFHQLETRMRGKSPYYRQMILTFNPVSISHWLKKLFFDRKYPKTYVHESTYKDNRFLDRDYIEKLEAFKDIDEYYYMVYCLGHWGSVFRSIFPTAAITARLAKLQNPKRLGFFEGKDFVEDKDGFIRIYAEPKKGRPYVIGADTAGEGSDFFAAHVIDNVTGEQVAVLHAQIDETVFPEQLMALGKETSTSAYGTYIISLAERNKKF